MIGDNIPHHITCTDDARAYASAIAGLRTEIDSLTANYQGELDELAAAAKAQRKDRDERISPLVNRAAALREVLAEWLAGDPDGNLRDGERIVATLSHKAGKPQVHADQLPDEFKSLQPDLGKINAAIARGEKVPGVVVKVETTLRVL